MYAHFASNLFFLERAGELHQYIKKKRGKEPQNTLPVRDGHGLLRPPLPLADLVRSRTLILARAGFRWDRQWMVVNTKGRAVTQRVEPSLALVEADMPPEDFAVEDWQPAPDSHSHMGILLVHSAFIRFCQNKNCSYQSCSVSFRGHSKLNVSLLCAFEPLHLQSSERQEWTL